MGNRKEVHTVPKGNHWENISDGETRSRHNTKDNALDKGRSIAKKDGAEHVIHGKDGKIQRSNSYGDDPNPPRDKK